MKSKTITLLLLLYFLNGFAQKTMCVVISTALGDLLVELYPNKAPKTVHNFLQYVSHDLYTNSSFFRVCTQENEADRDIKIDVIQGGNVPEKQLFPPIALETTQQTGIKHVNGTISMARGTPDSAQSSFFICINKQAALDFNGKRNPDGQGFAAFGKVIKGMDVVLKIQSSKNVEQYISTPVLIKTIKIIP